MSIFRMAVAWKSLLDRLGWNNSERTVLMFLAMECSYLLFVAGKTRSGST